VAALSVSAAPLMESEIVLASDSMHHIKNADLQVTERQFGVLNLASNPRGNLDQLLAAVGLASGESPANLVTRVATKKD
jgi:hypothetical protein